MRSSVTQRAATHRPGTRWVFVMSAVLVALYALNIALGMAAVKLGFAVWRLGDVGEFLLVLACMGFFVAGLVADEDRRAARPEEAAGEEVDDSHRTEGGMQ
jgi:hypothetical protein